MADNNPAQNDVLTPPSLIGDLGKWLRPLSGDISCAEVPSAQPSPRHLLSNRPDEHSKSRMKEGAETLSDMVTFQNRAVVVSYGNGSASFDQKVIVEARMFHVVNDSSEKCCG